MYCDWPTLGRCCFCMPLRKGVLTFAYIHIFFSAFMVGIYSYSVEYAGAVEWLTYGRSLSLTSELCVAFYCFELIFDGVLIYGAHRKSLRFVNAYFCYTVITCVAMLIIQIVELAGMYRVHVGNIIEICTLAFATLCLQIYLLTLVRSLVRKLETSGPHVYGNQLHQIVTGEAKVESNGVYNNTTIEPTHV